MKRRRLVITLLSPIMFGAGPGPALAQVAGSTIGIAIAELSTVAIGWSAKKQILGHTLYNERDEKVGTIEDSIIAPDRAVSYAIVGVGGFAALGKHDVAIPVNNSERKEAGSSSPSIRRHDRTDAGIQILGAAVERILITHLAV
jgi:hypothetical protein